MIFIGVQKAHGINNDKGDFIISDGLINRFKEHHEILIYSGAQIISLDILNEYQKEKFSFNVVWDKLIDRQLISGDVMKSDWYHIGDIKALKEAENLIF